MGSIDELTKVGNAFADLRRWDEAISAYSLALAQEPENGAVLANRALCYAWTNRVDEAESDLEHAEQLLPDSAILHRVRAIIADRRSDEDVELAELTKSLQLEPGNPFALSFRAHLYERRLLYQSALADADSYIESQPDEPEAYEMKAEILGAQRRWPEALAVAKLLEARFSDEPRALASAAQIYSNAGHRGEALATMNRVLQMDEGLYHFWDMKSGMRRWDDFDGRQADLDTALKLVPNDLGLITKLGLVAFDRGKWADAKTRFTQVLEREPKDFGVLAYRAMSSLELGEQANALEDYHSALAVAAGSDDYSLIGRVFALEGIAPEWGLSSCNRALALKPGDPFYLTNRGLARLRLKDVSGAYRDFDRAISKDPNRANAYYGRAIAKYRMGDVAKATQDRLTALAIDPTVEEDFIAHGMTELQPRSDTLKAEGAAEAGAV